MSEAKQSCRRCCEQLSFTGQGLRPCVLRQASFAGSREIDSEAATMRFGVVRKRKEQPPMAPCAMELHPKTQIPSVRPYVRGF